MGRANNASWNFTVSKERYKISLPAVASNFLQVVCTQSGVNTELEDFHNEHIFLFFCRGNLPGGSHGCHCRQGAEAKRRGAPDIVHL